MSGTLREGVRVLLWLSFLCGVSAASAQDQSSNQSTSTAALNPINTDRPAFTNSSVVVPRGSLQLENGFLDTGGQGQHSFDFPETAMRFGMTDKTELRLTTPDYYQTFNSGLGFGSGFSDLTLGVKQQLGPTLGGFDVSLILAVSLPTGANSVSSHGYDPEVQLPWSRKLSENWTAAGMLSVYWPTQGDKRDVTGQTTLEFDRQITKPWDAFIEYAGDVPQRGGPEHILHFGSAYKIGVRQQIDFHVGFGLSAAAPDHFIGLGYAFLLQKMGRRDSH